MTKTLEERSMTNTEILLFILGYQGGTVHQLSKEIGIGVNEILDADYNTMQDLMRLAQSIKYSTSHEKLKERIKEQQETILNITKVIKQQKRTKDKLIRELEAEPTEEEVEAVANAICDASLETHRDEYSCLIQDRGQSMLDVATVLAKAALEAARKVRMNTENGE